MTWGASVGCGQKVSSKEHRPANNFEIKMRTRSVSLPVGAEARLKIEGRNTVRNLTGIGVVFN